MFERRHVLTAALTAYVFILVMGSWPAPIRPAFLEWPHAEANALLRQLGWRAGQDVFTIPDRVDETYRAYCTYVKANLPGGGETRLQPREGHCPYRRIRLRTPASEIFEARILNLAWETRKVTRDRHPTEIEMLGSLGRFHCRQAAARGLAATSVSVAHFAYMESDADAQVRVNPLVAFEWSCDVDRPWTILYGVTAEELVSFWGSTPWP